MADMSLRETVHGVCLEVASELGGFARDGSGASAVVRADTELARLGWNITRTPRLLERLERRLVVDLSTVSVFELYTFGDLVDEVTQAVEDARSIASAADRAPAREP